MAKSKRPRKDSNKKRGQKKETDSRNLTSENNLRAEQNRQSVRDVDDIGTGQADENEGTSNTRAKGMDL
jgi:hypothetical protein